ncbi:MAG: hypothetical protein IPK22_01390 [Verrucomicrobiaceae bacterium]|nr:hypothetical protein [Verrucomicrobiaceae bacterium]
MRPFLSALLAALGVCFAALHFAGFMHWLAGSACAFIEVAGQASVSPSELSAGIGENIILFVLRGLFSILPAALLYTVLVATKFRKPWFYYSTYCACLFFFILIPIGSVFGLILFIALRRRKTEFFNSSQTTKSPPPILNTTKP